jgi:ribosomal protein S18 acetylase RimI-like enzyme
MRYNPAMSEAGQGIEVTRVEPALRRDALALLLTGRLGGDEAAVNRFLDFAEQQGLNTEHFFVARSGRRILGCALLVPGAGRTAMAFVNPIAAAEQVGDIGALIAHATAALDPMAVRVVQALLEPNQNLEREAYERAGYWKLAVLVYMQCRAVRQAVALELPRGLRALTWDDARREVFAAAIEASYRDTLDCPGLMGMRTIDDILAGHLATGEFDPSLWHVILDGDKPSGVLLLSRVLEGRSLELVYLGLAPSVRGRGVAQRLMRFGLSEAHRRGAAGMILAVDEDNAPALKLYRGLGFVPNTKKVAMIHGTKPVVDPETTGAGPGPGR